MTEKDFLALLPIVADQGWRVTQEGCIRNRRKQCPICALAQAINPQVRERGAFLTAWRAVSPQTCEKDIPVLNNIVVAADTYLDQTRRDKLLQALIQRA